MELNKEIINIPIQIIDVQNMNVFDKLLIWNHANVNNLYNRAKLKLSVEKDHWVNYKIDWKTFNLPYIKEESKSVITMNKGVVSMNKETKLVGREKEIHRWYWLFKKEIFNGRKV